MVRRATVSAKPDGVNPALVGLRMLMVCGLALVLVAGSAGVPMVMPTFDLATAHATPAPGEPGGNHSKPGDNKKKKKPPQRSSPRGSDTSDQRRTSNQGSNSTSQRPTSTIDAQQTRQSSLPQRRPDGRFAPGNSGQVGYDEEQESFNAREADTGIPIERRKVRVSLPNPDDPDGNPLTRFYDGLEEIAPGEYRGLEHKAGGAVPTPRQKIFDGLVNAGIPANGTLDGDPIKVIEAETVRPAPVPGAPAPPAPAAVPAPAAPPAPVAPPPAPPPASAPIALPAPAIAAPPAVVVTPADTGIAWGAMFHEYAQSFYAPIVTVGAGLAAVGGLLAYPFAGPGVAGGG
jgi:hypothetical protein